MLKRKEKELNKVLDKHLKDTRKVYNKVLHQKDGNSTFVCGKLKALLDLKEDLNK